MNNQIQVLILEDSSIDGELLVRTIEKGGYELIWKQVDNDFAFRALLESQSWDIVISDFNIPGFGAIMALETLKELNITIPFLVVSGAIGEETAVGLMKAGAEDYVMKSNLPKIVPTISRILRDVETRRSEIAARKAEEKALRDRENLLAIVSHDLKNPISSIKLNHQLIERMLKKSNLADISQTVSEHVERAQRAVTRMELLIQDILDISKIEAGGLVLSKTNAQVDLIVSEVVELFQPLVIQKSIYLDATLPEEDSCIGVFDSHKIHQVLSNLIGNAIKFSPPKSTVRLRIVRSSEELIFSVEDRGPGIPKELQTQIFESFFQATNTSGQGFGLGLAIAQGIVRLHGGKLWVESEPGHGSTFIFSIPQPVRIVDIAEELVNKKTLSLSSERQEYN